VAFLSPSESSKSIPSFGERLELFRCGCGRDPVVAQLRVVLPHRCGEVLIHEVPDGNRDAIATGTVFDSPIDRRATRRAEVVVRRLRLTGLTFDAVHFKSVVDLGLSTDLDALIPGEVGLKTECAAGSLLAEVAVAGGDQRRFVFDGDAYSTTPAR